MRITGIYQHLTAPNDREKTIPTFKDVLVDSLTFGVVTGPEAGQTNAKLWAIAKKLIDGDRGGFEIEQAEFQILKDKVTTNPAAYFTWVHGQVMMKIKEWEKSNDEKDK